MIKKYGVLALMLLIALQPAGVLAQGNNPVPLSGGYTISLPDGWQQAESDDVYSFSQGDLAIILILPDVLAAQLYLNALMDAADVLVADYEAMAGQTLHKASDIQVYQSDGREMATYRFERNNGALRGISVVLEVEPGQFALMEFQSPADQYAAALRDAFTIMESLHVDIPAAGAPAAGAPAAGTSSGEPCQVRAANASVQLRVGPGPNRGIYTGMAADIAYGVLGKKTVEDGSLWWRLDTDTGSANELWVADTDVEKTGDCDQVADVDAPPLIFGPPPAAPAPSEGTGGETPAEDEQPGANPSKIPANGSWYVQIGAEATVSCQGGPTQRISSGDLAFASGTLRLTASADGRSLVFGGLVFYGTDGYYQAQQTNNGWYETIRLYVSSPTQMSGEYAIAKIGLPCSGGVPISFSYLG